MKATFFPNLLSAVRKYWFRLAMIALFLYVFFQKDLSFQVNLRTPSSELQETSEVAPPNPKSTSKLIKSDVREAERFDFGLPGAPDEQLSAAAMLETVSRQQVEDYLKRFAHVAVSEQKKYGIPASVTLANGLLHSAAGTTHLVRQTHNHFALPCGENWDGAQLNTSEGCFRKYPNAWSAFRDHSLFLSSGKFGKLRQIGSRDYKKWAEGLERFGFSDEPGLQNQLLRLIEQYRLYELDDK